MRATSWNSVVARLRDERGMALVMALGVMATIGILGGSLALYSTSNERGANRSSADQKVYAGAQSGLDNAVAVLGAQSTSGIRSATVFSSLSAANRTATINGVSVTWNGTLVDTPVGLLHNYKWQLTSTGSLASPSGTGTISRTITADVVLVPKATQTMSGSAWNYVYSWQPSGCGGSANHSDLATNMYFEADFCMSNNSQLVGAVDLVVRGKTTMSSPQNAIGTSSVPLTHNWMALGCTSKSNGTLHSPCTSADKVYPNSVSTGVPSIARPVADFTDWYSVASPGPKNACGSGSTGSLTFDNNTVQDGSLPATNLTPGTAYDCITPTGRIKWVPGSPGTLTINGTVYFDGPGQMSGSANYDGQGAVYFNGTWTMWQNNLCAIYSSGTTCNITAGSWTGSPDILVIVSNSTSSIGQSTFQGALYSNGTVTVSNSAAMQGPIVATVVDLQNLTSTNVFPLNMAVPFGTPTPTNDISQWTMTPPLNYAG